MSILINGDDVVMSDNVVTGHNIHSKGNLYHDTNDIIQAKLKEHMQDLGTMQNTYLKLMNSYKSTVGIVAKNIRRNKPFGENFLLSNREAFVQLMPSVRLNIASDIRRNARLQNVLLDHHDYLYNTINISTRGSSQATYQHGRKMNDVVYNNTANTDTNSNVRLLGDLDLNKIDSLIAYYSDRDVTQNNNFAYDVDGKFGNKEFLTNLPGNRFVPIDWKIEYKLIWFNGGTDFGSSVENQLYYIDFKGSKTSNEVLTNNWLDKYDIDAKNCNSIDEFSEELNNFNINFQKAREIINCTSSDSGSIAKSSSFTSTNQASDIVAWDSNSNATNNMTNGDHSKNITINGKSFIENKQVSINNTSSNNETLFIYCPGIVFRYGMLFEYFKSGLPDNGGLADIKNKTHVKKINDTFDADDYEYVQVYENFEDGNITTNYYGIKNGVNPFKVNHVNLVPNHFCYNESSDTYSIRLYAIRKTTKLVYSNANENYKDCITLINDVPGMIHVLQNNQTLGNATELKDSQFGTTLGTNNGQSQSGKWCSARPAVNVQAKHILAMTYLIRFHTMFIQREMQLMNYYQYGTVVYVNTDDEIKEYFKRGDGGKPVANTESDVPLNVVDLYTADSIRPVNELHPSKPLDKLLSSSQAQLYIVLPISSSVIIDTTKNVDTLNVIPSVITPAKLSSLFHLVEWTKSNVNKARELSSGRTFQGLNFEMYRKLGKDLKQSYEMAENDIQEINKLHAMQEDLTAIGNKNYYMMLIYMVILFFLLVSIYYISRQ